MKVEKLSKAIVNKTPHRVVVVFKDGQGTWEKRTLLPDGDPIRLHRVGCGKRRIIDNIPAVGYAVDIAQAEKEVIKVAKKHDAFVLVSNRVLDALSSPQALTVAVAPDTSKGSAIRNVNEKGVEGVHRLRFRPV